MTKLVAKKEKNILRNSLKNYFLIDKLTQEMFCYIFKTKNTTDYKNIHTKDGKIDFPDERSP